MRNVITFFLPKNYWLGATNITFKIKDKNIYSSDGKFLKKIHCPINVSIANLNKVSEIEFNCKFCEKKVINTDYLDEVEITNLIGEDPTICLSIHPANPLFRIE